MLCAAQNFLHLACTRCPSWFLHHSRLLSSCVALQHIANVMASSRKLRQLGEERLMQANLALYQRLQAVRPSKDVDKARLGAEYRRSRGYLINLRTVPDAPPAPSAALQPQPQAWNERWQARPSTC